MANSLWNTADSTLVGAFTKAGLASAPQDYFRQFQAAAQSYDATVKASAEMWANIINAGVDMYGTYKARKAAAEAGQMKGPDFSDFHNKAKELRAEEATLSNIDPADLSLEQKQRLKKISQERTSMTSFAESAIANTPAFQSIMEKNDEKATRPYDMERALTYQAFLQGTGPTERGNYIRPEEDENGMWGFTMYHDPKAVTAENIIPLGIVNPNEIGKKVSFGKDDVYTETTGDDLSGPKERKYADLDERGGEPILGMNGEKIRFNISDLRKSIIPVDEGRKLQQAEDARIGTLAGFGINSPTLSPKEGKRLEDSIDDLIKNFGKQAWYTPSLYSSNRDGNSMSFFGEMVGIDNSGTPTQTVASAKAFGALSAVLPKDENGNLIPKGVISGVKDVGSPGINFEDFQTPENYLRLTQAMFNPGDPNYSEKQTHKIFREYKLQQVKGEVASMWNKSPRNPDNQTNVINERPDNDGFVAMKKATNADMFQNGNGAYMSPAKLSAWENIGKALVQRANMGKGKNMFSWDKDKQSYFHATHGVAPNKASLFAMINFIDTGEEDVLTTTFKQNPFYKQIPDWDGSMYLDNNTEKVVDGDGEPFWKFWK